MSKLENIIEALSIHEDNDAVRILDEIGTNCEIDDVRELTAKALVKRNSEESLNLVINHDGKGINDLSPRVVMTTINELLALENKENVIKVLDKTIEENENQDVKDTASSIKALMTFTS